MSEDKPDFEDWSDPDPWFCNLCGRMSSPHHIGRLHRIALFDAQSSTKYLPRTRAEVEANVEERTPIVLAALGNPNAWRTD